MKLLEGRLRGTLIPTPKDHFDSRSNLLGYPFYLTHHLLNHPYPPKAYKTWLILHGKGEKKLCCCTQVLAKSRVSIEETSWSFEDKAWHVKRHHNTKA